ncbi:spore gernimation protein [Brevibacillus laterosporus]|uniref:Spore gernimation protein n=1 Tax=Brevibacillus laterosporus TaxID=1465 RepID=A0A502ITF5_BRELA|nr:endospore germination permease [Brevibacillus laterosporus]QDX95417.1 spore gernimation protein [Brevibacillus laterosporus]TPG89184.1 spore gernimation protein [Brevibacillus laterosporus]
MNKYRNNEITLMQYILLIHGTQVGIGILTLPRELTEIAGTDGWISILLGWMLSICASLLITYIMKKHPQKTLFDLLPYYFGTWLGNFGNLLMILYGAFVTVTVLFTALFVINVWVLVETPNYMILALYLIPAYIIGHKGVRVLGRYSEIIFFLTLWIPILLLVPLQDAHPLHLLPVIKEGWLPIFHAVKTTIVSFLGFEMAFFFYPFLTCKQHATKGIVIANTLSLLVFLHITLITYLFYSPYESIQYQWPTLNLLKEIEFPFLERFEIIFLSSYMVVLSTTWLPYTFITVFGSSTLLKKEAHYQQHLLVFLVLLLITGFFFQPSYTQIAQLAKAWGAAGSIIAYVLPVVLWLYMGLHHFFQRRISLK